MVRAPDGIVAEVSLERGEWITPSPPGILMPAVLDILDPDSIYVSALLDEVDRGKVALGLPVRASRWTPTAGRRSGHGVAHRPLHLGRRRAGRTFETEATFDDGPFARDAPARASADIEVILRGKADVLRIPPTRRSRASAFSFSRTTARRRPAPLAAFRAPPAGAEAVLVSREVKVGLKNWEFAEVLEGLREGERIVVSLVRAEVKEGARARQAAVTEK